MFTTVIQHGLHLVHFEILLKLVVVVIYMLTVFCPVFSADEIKSKDQDRPPDVSDTSVNENMENNSGHDQDDSHPQEAAVSSSDSDEIENMSSHEEKPNQGNQKSYIECNTASMDENGSVLNLKRQHNFDSNEPIDLSTKTKKPRDSISSDAENSTNTEVALNLSHSKQPSYVSLPSSLQTLQQKFGSSSTFSSPKTYNFRENGSKVNGHFYSEAYSAAIGRGIPEPVQNTRSYLGNPKVVQKTTEVGPAFSQTNPFTSLPFPFGDKDHGNSLQSLDSSFTDFVCSCKKSFFSLYDLSVHIKESGHAPSTNKKNHHNDFPKLVRGQDMWLHHSPEQTRQILRCITCGESFKSLPDLTVHMMKTEHYTHFVISDKKIYHRAGEGEESESIFKCKECQLVFSDLQGLGQHMAESGHHRQQFSKGKIKFKREKRLESNSSDPDTSPTCTLHHSENGGVPLKSNQNSEEKIKPKDVDSGTLKQERHHIAKSVSCDEPKSSSKVNRSPTVATLLEQKRKSPRVGGQSSPSEEVAKEDSDFQKKQNRKRSFSDSSDDLSSNDSFMVPKISCENCGKKIESSIFVDHVRRCVYLSTSKKLKPNGSRSPTKNGAALDTSRTSVIKTNYIRPESENLSSTGSALKAMESLLAKFSSNSRTTKPSLSPLSLMDRYIDNRFPLGQATDFTMKKSDVEEKEFVPMKTERNSTTPEQKLKVEISANEQKCLKSDNGDKITDSASILKAMAQMTANSGKEVSTGTEILNPMNTSETIDSKSVLDSLQGLVEIHTTSAEHPLDSLRKLLTRTQSNDVSSVQTSLEKIPIVCVCQPNEMQENDGEKNGLDSNSNISKNSPKKGSGKQCVKESKTEKTGIKKEIKIENEMSENNDYNESDPVTDQTDCDTSSSPSDNTNVEGKWKNWTDRFRCTHCQRSFVTKGSFRYHQSRCPISEKKKYSPNNGKTINDTITTTPFVYMPLDHNARTSPQSNSKFSKYYELAKELANKTKRD